MNSLQILKVPTNETTTLHEQCVLVLSLKTIF